MFVSETFIPLPCSWGNKKVKKKKAGTAGKAEEVTEGSKGAVSAHQLGQTGTSILVNGKAILVAWMMLRAVDNVTLMLVGVGCARDGMRKCERETE